jgi:hypothetical protein
VAGAPIAILTRVLVEGMVEADSTLDAGRLYRVAAACGMSEQQVRLCRRRMAAEGALIQTGRGHLTYGYGTDVWFKTSGPPRQSWRPDRLVLSQPGT